MKNIAIVALALFASCSGSNPKELTDAGYAALGRGENTAAVAHFDEALAKIGNANDASYLRAQLGRCQALAKVDPVKTKTDFLALAKSQPSRISDKDFKMVGEFLLSANTSQARLEAIDLLVAGEKMFPESTDVTAFKQRVIDDSHRTADAASLSRLRGLGYIQ
jgi:hypothetical protein